MHSSPAARPLKAAVDRPSKARAGLLSVGAGLGSRVENSKMTKLRALLTSARMSYSLELNASIPTTPATSVD